MKPGRDVFRKSKTSFVPDPFTYTSIELEARYVGLGHDRKCHSVLLLDELPDLFTRSRLLGEELIAGESDEGEPAIFVLFIQRLQALILRGETAGRSSIHNQHDVSPELREVA